MVDPHPMGMLAETMRRLQELERKIDDKPLETGSGGGDSTGMEARVAKLEAHMEHVRADTGALKTDAGTIKTTLATLVERVAHLPSKGFIVTALLVALAVLAAVSLFAPNLQRMVGVTPSVSASPPPVAAPLPPRIVPG